MTNSTYFATVNTILQLAGQAPIPDVGTFATTASLEKCQIQAKLFVDKANRKLVRHNRTRFTCRKYTLTTSSASNSYSLTAGATSAPNVRVENMVEHSMFNTTSGQGYGPLKFIPRYKQLQVFPDGETVKGKPIRWYDLPPQDDGVERIAFSPPPDATYTIIFDYYEDPVVLSGPTDVIQWPTVWEDVLWDYGQMYLEMALSEGKQKDLASLMVNLETEIRQLTMGATDQPPCAELGINITAGIPRRRSSRSYP